MCSCRTCISVILSYYKEEVKRQDKCFLNYSNSVITVTCTVEATLRIQLVFPHRFSIMGQKADTVSSVELPTSCDLQSLLGESGRSLQK